MWAALQHLACDYPVLHINMFKAVPKWHLEVYLLTASKFLTVYKVIFQLMHRKIDESGSPTITCPICSLFLDLELCSNMQCYFVASLIRTDTKWALQSRCFS